MTAQGGNINVGKNVHIDASGADGGYVYAMGRGDVNFSGTADLSATKVQDSYTYLTVQRDRAAAATKRTAAVSTFIPPKPTRPAVVVQHTCTPPKATLTLTTAAMAPHLTLVVPTMLTAMVEMAVPVISTPAKVMSISTAVVPF
ncbi:MAG: hypothetical protein R2857_05035 [Vampirovibrionales bacterium]